MATKAVILVQDIDNPFKVSIFARPSTADGCVYDDEKQMCLDTIITAAEGFASMTQVALIKTEIGKTYDQVMLDVVEKKLSKPGYYLVGGGFSLSDIQSKDIQSKDVESKDVKVADTMEGESTTYTLDLCQLTISSVSGYLYGVHETRTFRRVKKITALLIPLPMPIKMVCSESCRARTGILHEISNTKGVKISQYPDKLMSELKQRLAKLNLAKLNVTKPVT
jgi:hypothetical protein